MGTKKNLKFAEKSKVKVKKTPCYNRPDFGHVKSLRANSCLDKKCPFTNVLPTGHKCPVHTTLP